MSDLSDSVREPDSHQAEELRMFLSIIATGVMRLYDAIMLNTYMIDADAAAAVDRLKDKHARGEFEFPMIFGPEE